MEHFVPYSFVSHDQIWNLIPADNSFNITKSNILPPLEQYFESFYELQRLALDIYLHERPKEKLLEDYFALNDIEKADLDNAIQLAKLLIEQEYTPDGYNIGMNCGVAAGQTVFHFHCHLIPRYIGDMDDPSGGVRHCIEGKGRY